MFFVFVLCVMESYRICCVLFLRDTQQTLQIKIGGGGESRIQRSLSGNCLASGAGGAGGYNGFVWCGVFVTVWCGVVVLLFVWVWCWVLGDVLAAAYVCRLLLLCTDSLSCGLRCCASWCVVLYCCIVVCCMCSGGAGGNAKCTSGIVAGAGLLLLVLCVLCAVLCCILLCGSLR